MMHALFSNLLVYLLGGVTFIPLLLVLLIGHAYFTLPVHNPPSSQTLVDESLDLTEREKDTADEELKGLPQDFKFRTHEPDVAAGYFHVCREFDGGQSLGKPLDKASIAASSSATPESPSVYQTMYRSIFERGKTQSPSINGGPKGSRRTRNVFFIVIRLGLLMLYDDSEQLEVRHVISLAHYDIDIYGGGELIPEGELFVKRNCIRMLPKVKQDITTPDAKPFFLFTTNCSEKEDFYYAMLQNQARESPSAMPALQFNDDDMVKLIRQLHASQDNFQTRWINALLGRVFLSMYKTALFEQFVRKKINKKLGRVAKPAFISAIQIRNINLGDSAPFFTGPKLRELTRDGDLTLEADVKYKGNARIDVATVAKIDLGPRFKVREVQLVLAVVCKSLEGHMFFRVKPPPSNRIWFTFETMPKLDLSIEPVVSTRQITYSLILRAIESRLREVIAETLVHPNWDDVPFFDTIERPIRAGIWQSDSAEALEAAVAAEPLPAEGGASTLMQEDDNREESEEKVLADEAITTATETTNDTLINRKKKRANSSKLDSSSETGVWSSSSDNLPSTSPRPMRAKSFATAAIPIVSHDQAVVEAVRDGNRSGQLDAAAGLKDINSRSQSNTPTESPVGSPSTQGNFSRAKGRSMSTTSRRSTFDSESASLRAATRESTLKDTERDSLATDVDGSSIRSESSANTQKTVKRVQAIASTAAAARKWGMEFVARHAPQSSTSSIGSAKTDLDDTQLDHDSPTTLRSPATKAVKEVLGSKLNPIGRGQPLPPVGQPLPGPKNNRTLWTGPLNILGRKAQGMDSKTANSSTASILSSASSAPIDVPLNGTPTQEAQTLENAGIPPSDLDGAARSNSIAQSERKGSTTQHSRVNSTQLSKEDLSEMGQDSVLVIKAPEQDLDLDSCDGSAGVEPDESAEPPEIFPMSESPAKEVPVIAATMKPIESPIKPHTGPSELSMASLSTHEENLENENDQDLEDYVVPEPSSSSQPLAPSPSPPPLPPTPISKQSSRIALRKTSSFSTPAPIMRRPSDSPVATHSSPSPIQSSPVKAENPMPISSMSTASSTPDMVPSPSSSNASSSGLLDATVGRNSGLNVGEQPVRVPRKPRSRQSLIPTPSHPVGSRRSSPGEWNFESRIANKD